MEFADGESIYAATTWYFAGGAYEVQDNGATETIRKYYSFAGMAVAMQSCTGSDCSLVTAKWTLVYFLTDHLGSIAAVTDDSGALLSEQRYEPFGEVRQDVGTVTETDLSFTGQRSLDSQGSAYSLGLMDYREASPKGTKPARTRKLKTKRRQK